MRIMTCSKCGEEFELLPDKRGFANVCPQCQESPLEREKKAAEEQRIHKALVSALRSNTRNREHERETDRTLKRLGLEVVRAWKIRVPE